MLTIQDVAITYQGVIAAVRGVSIDVPDGKVVSLLGANGAGKTSLLRAVSGLLPLHGGALVRGTITFDGRRIDRLDATELVRRGITQVLEGRRLFTELTIDENLRIGAMTARRAAASAGSPSARGRWPASVARRRKGSRQSSCAAPAGSGTAPARGRTRG